MNKQKILSVAFYAVLGVIVITCALQVASTYSAIQSATVAAWVQAVGSILAIIGAAAIAGWQQRRSRKERSRDQGIRRWIIETRVRMWAGDVWARSTALAEPIARLVLMHIDDKDEEKRSIAVRTLCIQPTISLDLFSLSLEDAPEIAAEEILLFQSVESYNRSISNFVPRVFSPADVEEQHMHIIGFRKHINEQALKIQYFGGRPIFSRPRPWQSA